MTDVIMIINNFKPLYAETKLLNIIKHSMFGSVMYVLKNRFYILVKHIEAASQITVNFI